MIEESLRRSERLLERYEEYSHDRRIGDYADVPASPQKPYTPPVRDPNDKMLCDVCKNPLGGPDGWRLVYWWGDDWEIVRTGRHHATFQCSPGNIREWDAFWNVVKSRERDGAGLGDSVRA